jgi:hypothetical protein
MTIPRNAFAPSAAARGRTAVCASMRLGPEDGAVRKVGAEVGSRGGNGLRRFEGQNAQLGVA